MSKIDTRQVEKLSLAMSKCANGYEFHIVYAAISVMLAFLEEASGYDEDEVFAALRLNVRQVKSLVAEMRNNISN